MSATLSAGGVYRYDLVRVWDDSLRLIVWVGLNPSTADAEIDDPTIRRCMGFARRDGAGGIVMLNRFALRSTDPRNLNDTYNNPDPCGPDNSAVFEKWYTNPFVGRIVVAYGAFRVIRAGINPYHPRWVKGRPIWCLGTTKHGYPRHPLRVPYAQPFEPYPTPWVT